MFGTRYFLRTAATLLVASMVPTGFAAERGKFQGHAIFLDTKFHEVKTPEGHPYKAAWAGEQEGLIFHNGGGSALDRTLDRAHYIIQYVGDAGTSQSQPTDTGARVGTYHGTARITGGTGKFKGVRGTLVDVVEFKTDPAGGYNRASSKGEYWFVD